MRFEIWSEGVMNQVDYFHGYGEGKDQLEACRDLAKRDNAFALSLSLRSMTWWNSPLIFKIAER